MMGYSRSTVMRARSALIGVATRREIISRYELLHRLRLKGDFHNDHDRRMMSSLLGAVADEEYAHKRPLLTAIIAHTGPSTAGPDFWGLLGFWDLLRYPLVMDFIIQERKKVYKFWGWKT